MRQWFSLLALLIVGSGLGAQVVLSIDTLRDVQAGDRLIADVAVMGFDSISDAQFEVAFDPGVVEVIEATVPADTFTQSSPYQVSVLDSAVRFLYLEPNATGESGILDDGSILLRLEMNAIGNPGDSSCLGPVNGGFSTQFVKAAQEVLLVEVRKGSVHLRETSSVSSLEPPHFRYVWNSPNSITFDHEQGLRQAEISLISLSGRHIARKSVSQNTTRTQLIVPYPATDILVLSLRNGSTFVSRLIARP